MVKDLTGPPKVAQTQVKAKHGWALSCPKARRGWLACIYAKLFVSGDRTVAQVKKVISKKVRGKETS